jgi:hypothetical protein
MTWELTEDGIRVVLRIPIPSGHMISETTAKILRVSRFVPMKVKRRGVEMRIIFNCKDELPRKVDTALLKGALS